MLYIFYAMRHEQPYYITKLVMQFPSGEIAFNFSLMLPFTTIPVMENVWH
jgi:hypothetical protein